MANEAVCIEAPKLIVSRTCLDAVAIAKGTLLRLSGTNAVVLSAVKDEPFGGIAIEEKTASDGITSIGCALDGVWDIKSSSTATDAVGTIVSLSGANMYHKCAAGDLLTGAVIGSLEEVGTAAGTDRVRLRG